MGLIIGDEVFVINKRIFGNISSMGNDEFGIFIEGPGGGMVLSKRDGFVPTDKTKLDRDEPPLTTYKMAGRIPGMIMVDGKPGLIVAIGDSERNVQHFHVFSSDNDLHGWRNGACLMFTDNRYFDHSNRNNETLTKHEINALKMKLKSKRKDADMTYWDWIIRLWNDNNPLYPLPLDTPMPDYDYKTIKRYKEE